MTFPVPACARCPEPARLAWGASFRQQEYACPSHPPACMTSPAAALPHGFWCRALDYPVTRPQEGGELRMPDVKADG